MKEKLTEHIRLLFADAERRSPDNRQLAELKEELLLNTLEKYDHMLETGRTPEAAYALAVSGIGDIEGLLNDLIGAESSVERDRETGSPIASEQAEEAHEDRDPDRIGDEEDREEGGQRVGAQGVDQVSLVPGFQGVEDGDRLPPREQPQDHGRAHRGQPADQVDDVFERDGLQQGGHFPGALGRDVVVLAHDLLQPSDGFLRAVRALRMLRHGHSFPAGPPVRVARRSS